MAFLVTYSLCMFSASQTVHSLVVQVRFNGAIWGFPMGSGSGGPHSGEMDDGTCFYGVDSVRVVVKSANDSGVPGLVLAHLSQPPLGEKECTYGYIALPVSLTSWYVWLSSGCAGHPNSEATDLACGSAWEGHPLPLPLRPWRQGGIAGAQSRAAGVSLGPHQELSGPESPGGTEGPPPHSGEGCRWRPGWPCACAHLGTAWVVGACDTELEDSP